MEGVLQLPKRLWIGVFFCESSWVTIIRRVTISDDRISGLRPRTSTIRYRSSRILDFAGRLGHQEFFSITQINSVLRDPRMEGSTSNFVVRPPRGRVSTRKMFFYYLGNIVVFYFDNRVLELWFSITHSRTDGITNTYLRIVGRLVPLARE